MEGISYDQALDAVTQAIKEILTDRGEQTDVISEESALYAHDASVTDALNLDSMDALDLISLLEERLGVEVPDDFDFETVRTVRDLASAVAEHRS